jgi:MFS family permease
MRKRNLAVLTTCQLISATGSIVMVTLGGLVGAKLTNDPAFATLPVSIMVVAVAATTVPASLLMQRIGRARGFAAGSLCAAAGSAIAVVALSRASFSLFIVAGILFGVNMAFAQQYRYAAAESVESRFVPRAISLVLLGAIGGAFIGPELVIRGQQFVFDIPYAGTMMGLVALYLVQAALFVFGLRPVVHREEGHLEQVDRPLAGIVLQPVFLVAVLGATIGYGLMTLVMTATPLSMHLNDGHSLTHTAGVIRAHVLGMYVPSLFSGFLIERFGVSRLMFAGAVILLGTSVVGLQGQSVMHYWWALVLLGVGWNFLYVGGTTMLTYTYTMAERFRAQAFNEFLVFGTSATASLLAGTVMHYFGWLRLMLIPIPVLIVICVALVWIRRDPLLRRTHAAG